MSTAQSTGTRTQDIFAGVDVEELEAMVGPDRNRPGPDRWRLIAEQIPIWPLIGLAGALAGTTDPAELRREHVAQIADEYDVSEKAILAALHYYRRRRGAIDTLLEANAEALVPRHLR